MRMSFVSNDPSWSKLAVFAFMAFAPVSAIAQRAADAELAEERSEWVRELDEELREANANSERLEQRLAHARRRIELLSRMRKLAVEAQKTERRLEAAEQRDDDDAIEELEAAMHEIEVSGESLERRMQLHEHRGEIQELRQELRLEELRPLRREMDRLLRETDKAESQIEKWARSLFEEDEEALEPLERAWDTTIEDFEQTMELVRLRAALFWAREEGALGEAQEIERELKSIEDFRSRERDLEEDDIGATPAALPVALSEEDFHAAKELDFDRDIVSRLKRYCGDCHDASSASGDLDLDQLVATRPLVVRRKHWLNVIQQIKLRSMPPPDAEQPEESDRKLLAAWLTSTFNNFDYAAVRRPGHEPARRLTREEYNHTIRDLIGIDLRPADRFPADLSATSGFRNSANSLFFQPITLERFIAAAEQVVDQAFPEHAATSEQESAWTKLLGDADIGDADEARAVLERFLSRAYRRPAESGEVERMLARYNKRIDSGASQRAAMRDVLQVVLISPTFLFRSERVSADRISDFELASRLSYFLWASMPDEELFRHARLGTLSRPEILRQQVDRMLNDRRSETLGTLFAGQWFGTDKLHRVRPGQIDNPWATDGLISAMQAESALLFDTIVREDQPLSRLLDADYTFVNEELAQHYGMAGVSGATMRRVSLQNSKRRGLLGHGSVLAITSFPGRTSPVLRGNWILSELLGTPPPPPPPNVSQFDERVAENRRLSQRQKLQLHRRNPNCYACHSQIDPLGFALSEFDWFGRLRENQRGRRIDSRGKLPDGTVVDGLDGLNEALIGKRIDDLSRQLATKLLSYALGRQLEYYDEATIRELLIDFRQQDRHPRALIHAIVRTDAFQRNEPQE